VLTRAIDTLHIALAAMGRLWLPEEKDWRLNERHYGGLTGLDKAETAARHGTRGPHLAALVRPAATARSRKPGRPFRRPPLRRHPDTRHRKPQGRAAGASAIGMLESCRPALGERYDRGYGNDLRQ
jgi:hypothetical protein